MMNLPGFNEVVFTENNDPFILQGQYHGGWWPDSCHKYRKISNIRCTKSHNLNDSRLVVQLPFAQSIEARR